MKSISLLLISLLFFLDAKAQYVGLNKDEVLRLHLLVNTDKNYYKLFSPFLNKAKQALSETPNPIEEIESEGLLAGNPAKTASLKAVEDADKVYALGLAFSYYADKTYLNKAIEYLTAWATTNKPSGDPIDETKLEAMITGYDLIRNNVPAENKATVDGWLNSVADAEANSATAKGNRGTAINNWNSHRIKIITLINYTIQAGKYDAFIISELEKQLAANLNPNGTTWDFMQRDAFHYQTYDLEPLLTTCIVLYRATGKNYFIYQTPTGASIKQSVDFMVPYMTGEKTHAEFVNSKVPFDAARAKNNEKGFAPGTLFNPQSGIYTLSLASYFDPVYVATITKATNNQDYINWQMALNKITKIVN